MSFHINDTLYQRRYLDFVTDPTQNDLLLEKPLSSSHRPDARKIGHFLPANRWLLPDAKDFVLFCLFCFVEQTRPK